jgi:hypothetical protein
MNSTTLGDSSCLIELIEKKYLKLRIREVSVTNKTTIGINLSPSGNLSTRAKEKIQNMPIKYDTGIISEILRRKITDNE